MIFKVKCEICHRTPSIGVYITVHVNKGKSLGNAGKVYGA